MLRLHFFSFQVVGLALGRQLLLKGKVQLLSVYLLMELNPIHSYDLIFGIALFPGFVLEVLVLPHRLVFNYLEPRLLYQRQDLGV